MKENEGIVRNNTEYDDYVDMSRAVDPALAPLTANEEPTPEEQEHYDDLYADFIDELYENQVQNTEKILRSSQELFMGASDAAFTILNAVYQRHDQRDGPTPPSVIFGEGGMAHTAVDEMFKFAKAKGIPNADNQDHYTAAQVNMMRKIGEYLEAKSDDDAVEEAQSLLADVEMQDETYLGDPQPLRGEDRRALEDVAYQDAQAPAEEPMPEEEPMPGPAANGMPPSGGLV